MENWKTRLIYDRRKESKKTGTGRIEIEIYLPYDCSRVLIATDVRVAPSRWDSLHHLIIGPDASRLNTGLHRDMERISSVLLDIALAGQTLSGDVVRAALRMQRKQVSFLDWCYSELESRSITSETRRAHVRTLQLLERFGRLKTFRDLTVENIRLLDQYITKEAKRCQPTIHNYHKTLRVYINRAIQLGIIDENPYEHYRVRRGSYKERQVLSDYELHQLREVELKGYSLNTVRDAFIFCCYTGLSWCDLNAFDFQRHAVKAGSMWYIDGHRIKTGSAFFTPILAPAMEILRKYDYKLRVISNQKMNYELRKVRDAAGIHKPLTCHIARHTFATTVILGCGCSMESLSKMLGHKDLAVTKVYGRIMESNVERQEVHFAGII